MLNQIDGADAQGLLSTPVKYGEVRKHIDYMELITKEALRMSDISCSVLLASNCKANNSSVTQLPGRHSTASFRKEGL